MKITLADKFIAYLALLSGLTISAVAIWYSVAGLVSIFAAAVVPIIVMGVALEISKLVATIWLKLNWNRAPVFIRTYLLVAIAILMIITSMGIFGFLSKAHSDAGLVSGDVMAKIAVYDEKIKTAKDNIDTNRKALKQMDEAVDQVMGRSTSETGADKAVAIRRAQAKERARLQSEIAAEQKVIGKLNEERAPIAAEVRKVEAEVGPIKYIANFIYGDNPDANVLEKAVTWVIIIIVSVFDPLAVILLLASQYSFQWFRKAKEDDDEHLLHKTVPLSVADIAEPIAKEKVVPEPEEKTLAEQHPYLEQPFEHFKNLEPIVYKVEDTVTTDEVKEDPSQDTQLELDFTQSLPVEETKITDSPQLETDPLEQWNKMIEAAEEEVAKEKLAEDFKADFESGNIENIPWEAVEKIEEQKIEAVSEFPTDPFKGQTFISTDDRNFIFNGTTWINADLSDKEAVQNLISIGEESKKKDQLHDQGTGSTDSKDTNISYVQNSEQSPTSLWTRIKHRDS
jgi:hypothetical protein